MKHKRQREQDEVDSVKELFQDDHEAMEEIDSIEHDESSEIKPMTDSEIVTFCNEEISRAIGGTSYGDDASEDIALSYDYHFGRKPGLSLKTARDPKASRFVSLDVQDAVESTKAEIMPAFSTEELAFYEPENDRDEQQARLESDLANYIFFQECDGYMVLQNALTDALLNRNGSVSVFWDKRYYVTYTTYKNVHPIAMEQLLQPSSENETVEVVEQESEMTTISADGVNQIEIEVFTLLVKRITQKGKPVIEPVAPEHLMVSGDHTLPVLDEVRFAAREHIVTQSYLIEMGVPSELVEKLGDYNTNTEEQSRSRTAAEFDYFSTERSVRHIRIYECSALLDVDGDGIAERRRIIISENTLLFNDPVSSVDLISGVTTAISHKYKGLSLFDKIKDIQDAKTDVMRSIIDGTRLSSNPRTGVLTGEVNMDDMITSRTGGIVRMKRPDAVFGLPTGEVPQSSYGFIELMNAQRRERGGSAIDTATTAQSMDNAAEGTVARVMTAMELANALLAKTFGETFIRGLFVQLHRIIRENYEGEIAAKIRGQWVQSVPSEWIERTSVVVSVGDSAAERQRQKNAMLEIIQSQQLLQQSGSVMFSESKLYAAIIKSASLSGIKSPEQYYVDPDSEEGQQASQSQQQQSQERAQKEEMLAQAMAKAQSDIAQAEQMKGAAALQSQQVKMENDTLKNQLTEMKQLLDANAKTIDQDITIEKNETDAALALTKMEIEKDKDLSKQNEENRSGA